MTKLIRPWAAVVVSGTLFVLLIACASAGSRDRLVNQSSVSTSTTGDATAWTGAGSWSSATTSAVTCDGQTCEVTLGGGGATVQLLGATLAFDRVAGGVATVRVDDVPVSLREGNAIDQGAVHLLCTRVTASDVTLVVTPR